MAEILEARVIQKVGTEAEWLANPLPLLDGEAAIVRTGDGTPVNLKFGLDGKTFAELPYFIDYSQAAYIAYTATPTQPIAYTFVGEGTYGSITVAEGYMAVLGWDGTSWSKNAEIEMPSAPPVTKEDIQEFAYTKDEYVTQVLVDTAFAPTIRVNGVDVTDATSKLTMIKKLDQCIKSIKTFGVPDGKFVGIRQFSYNHSTNTVAIGFLVLENEKDQFNVATSTIAYKEAVYDTSKPFTVEVRQRYSPYTFISTLDVKPFVDDANTVSFNFRDGSGNVSYRSCGIKGTSLIQIPEKPIWGTGYLFNNESANDLIQGFYFHEAIRAIKLKSSREELVKFSAVSYVSAASSIQFVVMTCLDDDPNNMNVTTSRNGFSYLRIRVPVSANGQIKEKSYVFSGDSGTEIEMVVDMDYLKGKIADIPGSSIQLSNPSTLAQWVLSPGSGGGGGTFTSLNIIDGGDDLFGNFRFVPATANHVLSAGSNMFKLTRIPEGTNEIEFQMTFDGGNSNALWLDQDMKKISWVHNSPTTVSNIKATPPLGAVFILASTTTALSSCRVIARGVFSLDGSIKEYRSINEGLADKFSGQLFIVKGKFFKKLNSGICTINEYSSVNGGWLEEVPSWEKDGSYIIPTNVLHTNGINTFTGGSLCFIKQGVMYFYNAASCAIFKSLDWGLTYQTIIDKYSHPSVFNDDTVNNESRTTLIPLEDGELLIPVRIKGEEFATVPGESTPRRARYWAMYRTKNGQTDLEKCFNFSHESTIKDWVSPTDPQYQWSNHSTGCLLGDFTHQVYGNIVVITEYGHGTSKYWSEQGLSNNGRGVSARAWVSFDYGKPGTWKKMFDGDRKISGTAEADNNWFYFTSTNSAKSRHMHGVSLNSVRRTVKLTNGDLEDYIWSIGIDELESWYNTAQTVGADDIPAYSTSDTFPLWSSRLIVPANDNTDNAYNNNKSQQMQAIPVELGDLWGHDSARELATIEHGDVFEPVFQFEQRSDFADEASFIASQNSTDGFVQHISKVDGVIYITHSNGGTRPSRVWATIDGINYKIVYQGDNGDIKFAGKFLKEGNRAFLTDGTNGQASNITGFWRLKFLST